MSRERGPLLDAAERAGVSRFVQVSSPSVAHAGSALAGVGAEPADPRRARGEYARTKAEAELLALARDSPSMRVVAVRPHIVWGPGDTQLVARIVERARAGRLPLLDGGTALIDSTYVDNAATGIRAALDRAPEAHGRAFVLTNGEPRPGGRSARRHLPGRRRAAAAMERARVARPRRRLRRSSASGRSCPARMSRR